MANKNIKIISLTALVLLCAQTTVWAKDRHKPTYLAVKPTVSEQEQAERMTQELQQILQQVRALEEENNLLKQKIERATAQNQQLGEAINNMRPAATPSALAVNQATTSP